MKSKLFAALALLGLLGGCSMMPSWTPNVGADSPPIYEPSPSD